MALECLADSRANCFATADLTLMRSLRKNSCSMEARLRHPEEPQSGPNYLLITGQLRAVNKNVNKIEFADWAFGKSAE